MQFKIKSLLLLLVLISIVFKENINSIFIMLLFIYMVVEVIRSKTFNLTNLKSFLPFLLFFLFSVISVSYSEDRENAWKMITRFLPFCIFPIIFSILTINREELQFIMKGFVIWMMGVCLYSHTLVFIKLFKNNDNLYNLFNNDYSYLSLANETIGVHTTYYAYCVLIGIFFTLYLLFENRNSLLKILYFLLLTYFSFFIFHLSARTPIAIMFLVYNVAMVYYFMKFRKMKQGVIALLLFYFITGIVLYNVRVTRYRFQQVFGFTYYDGSHHEDGQYRVKQWESALFANQNILIGNGIGDANASIYNSYPNFDLEKYKDRRYNAHNQFIQTYVGLGFIGLGLLLFIFISYFKFFLKQKFLLGVVFVSASFISYITESFLERQIGIVLFTYLICFFVAYLKQKQSKKHISEINP